MDNITVAQIVCAVDGRLLRGDPAALISGVSIDSKEVKEGDLFVPLIGARVDAHQFLPAVFSKGAAASFTMRGEEELRAEGLWGEIPLVDAAKMACDESSRETGNKSDQETEKTADSESSRDARENGEKSIALILVKDTQKALQDLAAWYRNRFAIPVIGVTGSVGKTSTKEMIAAALQPALRVYKTAGNRNSQVGVPLSVLELDSSYEAAVLELGMSERGEMAILTRIARPTVAVITNIGDAHIGQLGSREAILREKCNIVDCFEEEDCLIVNGDDPLLRNLAENGEAALDEETDAHLEGVTILAYGSEKTADYQAIIPRDSQAIVLHDEGEKPDFQITRFGEIGRDEKRTLEQERDTAADLSAQDTISVRTPNETVNLTLSVPGAHHVSNALAALAVADVLGVPLSLAAAGLRDWQPPSMRGNVLLAGGMKLIDDTYNASPDSMKSGILMLRGMKGIKRRIAVLADALELGKTSESLHRDVGAFLARTGGIDLLLTVGEGGGWIAAGADDWLRENRYGETSTAGEDRKKSGSSDFSTAGEEREKPDSSDFRTENQTAVSEAPAVKRESKSLPEANPENSPQSRLEIYTFSNRKEAGEFLCSIMKPGDGILVKGSRGMHMEEIVSSWKEAAKKRS